MKKWVAKKLFRMFYKYIEVEWMEGRFQLGYDIKIKILGTTVGAMKLTKEKLESYWHV